MAQAIAYEEQRPTEEPELYPGGASGQRADALLSAHELLQVLHDRGVLEMAHAVAGECDARSESLDSMVCSPESIRGLHNVIVLTRLLAGIPPDALRNVIETTGASAQRERSNETPGLGRLLWRLRNKETRHTLAVMLDVLAALGKWL